MRYFRTRMRSTRFLLVSAAVGIVVLAGAAVATASLVGYPTDSVTVMTGCLTTNGTGAGNIVNVAASPSNPSKACGSNQKLVHLSGGTITRVTAGSGLTTTGSGGTGGSGYVDNGFASLGLLPGFALPQACSAGQFPDWGGVSGTWGCGTDQNTTYSAGTGLDLSNANAFSINSAYQLPQSCSSGQIPGWNAQTLAWACANDQNTTYSGADFALSGHDCPAGQFVSGINASGGLKCAAPTIDDLQGSACTFNGQPATLDISTDNTTGAVTMNCSAGHIYWTNNGGGSVGRSNLNGTGVNENFIQFSSLHSQPIGIDLDSNHIYVTSPTLGPNCVARANRDGTGLNECFMSVAGSGQADGGASPWGVAVDSGHIYWSNFFDAIGRSNLDGTSPSTLISSDFDNVFLPWQIAVNGSHIYWANDGGDSIGRANLNGGSVTTLITGADHPSGVAVDGSHIYWTNSSANTIGRANLDGTGVNQSFITGASSPDGVTVDGNHIYWANHSGGTIGRANLDGTNADQSFITGAIAPSDVVVTSEN